MGKGIAGHELPNNGKTNEWYTPKYITDALGDFDLDPCTGVNRTRNIAAQAYTKIEDGLSQSWAGRVWMNPPYGERTKLWLEKMSQHQNGIVLIFARTETKMFHQFVWPSATGIFFFEGRIKFCDENDNPSAGSAGAPSCLVSYDPPGTTVNHDILRSCGLKGKFISLLASGP